MSEIPDTTQEPGAAVQSKPGRRFRRTALGALALLLILGATVAGLAWQATHGSVSLDFFRSRLEATLRARLPPQSTVTIGSTAVAYRSDQGIVLEARGLRLALPDVATVELAELATATTLSGLLRGQVDLSSVMVTGAKIAVVPPRLVRQGSPADIARTIARIFMAQVVAADNLVRRVGIEEVVVRNAALRIIDAAGQTGPALTISEANWMPLGPGRSKVWLQAIEENGAGWDLTVEHQIGRAGGTAVNVEIEDLPVAAFAPNLIDSAGEDAFFQSTVTLQTRMVSRQDGSFQGLRGVLSTGSGRLSVTGIDEINVAGGALSFTLGAAGDRLAFPKGEIRTGAGNMVFEGGLDLSNAERATLSGRIRSGSLPTIGTDRSVRITGGGLLLHINFRDPGLQVERVQLVTRDGTLSAIGQANLAGSAPGLSLALSLTEMPAAVARAFWPPFVAEKTRRWFDANVRSGMLGPATLQVSLPAEFIGRRGRDRILPDNALIGSLPFENGEFSPFRTFPVIREAAGYVDFGDATATVLAESGTVALPGRGDLQAGGTILVIPELGRPQPWGDLHLQLSGPAAALAALSNTPPLSVAADRNIQPEALSGQAQLLLDGSIPLFESDFRDVSSTFRLALTDFSSTAPISNRLIADADLVLEGSPQSFTVRGQGTMDGLQASVDLLLGSAAPGQSDVTVSLDDAARKRLGLGLGGLVTGPVLAAIKRSDDVRQQVALDLKGARISVPPLGWEKGPGVPATAAFVMEKTEEGTRIADLVLSGSGFGAKGGLSIGPDGRVKTVDLIEFALRAGDRLSVTAAASGGGYDVRVRGQALDARGIIRAVGEGMGGGGKTDIFPLRISLDVAEVTGQNNVLLSDVTGSMLITAKGLETVALKGAAKGNRGFEWTLGKEGGARVLRVAAADGGALIRFAGIYTKIADGRLVLDYRGTPGGAGTGVMVMQDFRLLNETALAPAVETARQTAARAARQVEAQTPGELRFTQVRIPFRQEGWVIAIDDAALRGPMLGATASGTVNIPGRKMAISGTFIPAFGLNNIAGAIPIIGTILGGGRDEGLVGITYKLFGPVANPKLAMNPISAIAPGIFRKIFEYR